MSFINRRGLGILIGAWFVMTAVLLNVAGSTLNQFVQSDEPGETCIQGTLMVEVPGGFMAIPGVQICGRDLRFAPPEALPPGSQDG
jgi:hypothetical protein